ncbi:MAG: hypothetical protein ACK4ND_04965 [Cytophagaceae bacterium]
MTILVLLALLSLILYSLALRKGFRWGDLRPSRYPNNPDIAPMNILTRISFTLFKFSSFGFILLYILVLIIVGGAGHSVGDSASFFGVVAYSVLLFLLISYFQKLVESGKQIGVKIKVCFAVLVLPAIFVSLVFLAALLYQRIEIGIIFIVLVLFIVLKHVLFSKYI